MLKQTYRKPKEMTRSNQRSLQGAYTKGRTTFFLFSVFFFFWGGGSLKGTQTHPGKGLCVLRIGRRAQRPRWEAEKPCAGATRAHQRDDASSALEGTLHLSGAAVLPPQTAPDTFPDWHPRTLDRVPGRHACNQTGPCGY